MRIDVHRVPLHTTTAFRPTARGADALHEAGLVEALGDAGHTVEDRGVVEVEPVVEDRTVGAIQNPGTYRENLDRIAEGLSERVGEADLDLVVGGECSLAPGPLEAVSRALGGPPGLVWLDAHGDYNTTQTTPSGFLGGMALALVCGRDPDLLEETAVASAVPPAGVVHVGARALDPPEAEAFEATGVDIWSVDRVRDRSDAARRIARSAAEGAEWLWVHLDVDVLDPTDLGGVDYPEPGGLTTAELEAILAEANETGRLALVTVASFNPEADPGGGAETVVGCVARGLSEG